MTTTSGPTRLGGDDVETVRIGVDTPALPAWRQLCGIGDTGALLVRPDHHVAWRARAIDESSGLARALDVVAARS